MSWDKEGAKEVHEEARPARSVKGVYSQLDHKRVVIQEKNGVIVRGLLCGYEEGFFEISDAEIKGRGVAVKPRNVWVDRGAVAHIHEETETQKVKAATDEARS